MLSPDDALPGFGSPALLTLIGLFVIAQGLLRSGALDRLRELLASPRIRSPRQLVALLTLVVAPLSGVIPNTPIVAILLPVIQGWCQRRSISPSQVLLPLSFATIIGRTLSLIGTSTILLASDLAAGLGYGSFQLFSFTAIGIPLWLLGSAYLLVSTPWLPDRGNGDHTNLRDLNREGYLTEVVVPAESPLVGLNLHDSRLQQSRDLVVLDQLDDDLPTTHRKHLAVAVMAAVLLLYGLGVMPLVANQLLATIQAWPAYCALVAACGLTLITTELLSNAAAVALVLPIAANLAPGLQLPPMLLITTVAFAACQSVLSPIGYQTNDQPDGVRPRPLLLP